MLPFLGILLVSGIEYEQEAESDNRRTDDVGAVEPLWNPVLLVRQQPEPEQEQAEIPGTDATAGHGDDCDDNDRQGPPTGEEEGKFYACCF